ncbi:hypothetical protein EON65_01660 [archaeon]|nr:MAG: hypothetical protein EON65_01660 [archaeon]
MGVAASVKTQRELYESIKKILEDRGEEKVEDNSDDYEYFYDNKVENHNDDASSVGFNGQETMDKVQKAVDSWHFRQFISRNVTHCTLFNFESTLDAYYAKYKDEPELLRTPIILDRSEDHKVATFFSYQLDVVLLHLNQFLPSHTSASSKNLSMEMKMENCRKLLVNAMKYGKTLVINFGSFIVNLQSIVQKIPIDIDVNNEHNKAYYEFPDEVVFNAGKKLISDYYTALLFRQEDMFPHKNFAYSNTNFRTCILSQFSVYELYSYLFHINEDNYKSALSCLISPTSNPSLPKGTISETTLSLNQHHPVPVKSGAPLFSPQQFQIFVIDYDTAAESEDEKSTQVL